MHNFLPFISKKLIGHRGAAGLCPENTLMSFQKAKSLGLNWVEFDVQRCASGEWVVIHDESVDRTSNSQGLVANLPYSYLKTLEAGLWFLPPVNHLHIPLLTETLIFLREHSLHPNIEIKCFKTSPNTMKEDLKNFLNVLEQFWPKSLAFPLVSSFDWEVLMILKALAPTLPLGYNLDELPNSGERSTLQSVIDKVLSNGLYSLHCNHEIVSRSDLQYANAKSLPILVYTLNDPQQIQYFLEMGAHAVFSDLTFVK